MFKSIIKIFIVIFFLIYFFAPVQWDHDNPLSIFLTRSIDILNFFVLSFWVSESLSLYISDTICSLILDLTCLLPIGKLSLILSNELSLYVLFLKWFS